MLPMLLLLQKEEEKTNNINHEIFFGWFSKILETKNKKGGEGVIFLFPPPFPSVLPPL
jgi:hypothetical protein